MEYPFITISQMFTLTWSDTVPVRVSFMGQIELFNHLRIIIFFSYLIPYYYVQIVYIRLEYLINRIINVKLKYLKPFNCANK